MSAFRTAPARAGLAVPAPSVPLRPWPDPVLDQFGHDPRSAYVERYWLPLLGPSSTLLLRHLAARFEDAPEGFDLDLRETSLALGIGGQGPGGTFTRTLERVISFGFVQLVGDATLVVRLRLPSLTRRQVQRLPPSLQAAHDQWQDEHDHRSLSADLRRRARTLALSLFELGEDYDGAERQLYRWRFHPALAHDAVRWAAAEHAVRLARSRSADATPLPRPAAAAEPPSASPIPAVRPTPWDSDAA